MVFIRGRAELWEHIAEPHCGQNHVLRVFPESATRFQRAGCPETTVRHSAGTWIQVLNALDVNFWHSAQWHVYAT